MYKIWEWQSNFNYPKGANLLISHNRKEDLKYADEEHSLIGIIDDPKEGELHIWLKKGEKVYKGGKKGWKSLEEKKKMLENVALQLLIQCRNMIGIIITNALGKDDTFHAEFWSKVEKMLLELINFIEGSP